MNAGKIVGVPRCAGHVLLPAIPFGSKHRLSAGLQPWNLLVTRLADVSGCIKSISNERSNGRSYEGQGHEKRGQIPQLLALLQTPPTMLKDTANRLGFSLALNGRLPNTNAPIPKGYYDGHIDLDTDGNMQAVQIILGPRTREVIGMAADASMPCEVLRFMKSSDIREID
jgi:hypothetical protein